MEFTHNIRARIRLMYGYIGLSLMLMVNTCFAQTIIIPPNTVISHSKTYNNVTLDMSNGSFIITNNATLTINNSVISGTLSKTIPVLINVEQGNLNLNNNQVNIKSHNLVPHPATQSLEHVIQLAMGELNMSSNSFQMDQMFTAGLLVTTASIPTSGIKIVNNKFTQFHGVIYLIGTDKALISNNTLTTNSYGNIVVIGSNSKIEGNTIQFSGNNRLGDSIDVIDSNNILVKNNVILTPTCHGIYIFNSHDVLVDHNRVTGGITYAMNVLSYPEKLSTFDSVAALVKNHAFKNLASKNITLSNNTMTQNRYGIAASDIDNLKVENNIFVQRFEDNDSRKFWTNNYTLLQNISNLSWHNNFYKEAYTQEQNGNNTKTGYMILFPQTGGVSL